MTKSSRARNKRRKCRKKQQKDFIAIVVMFGALYICLSGCADAIKEIDADNTIFYSAGTDYAEQSEAIAETSETQQTEEPTKESSEARNLIEDFPCICQYPELPTGCEVTALTMTLQWYGYDVDKVQISRQYLLKEPSYKTSPYKKFVGDPEDEGSYGCYAPVLVKCAEALGIESKDISGCDFDLLIEHVDKGQPVIMWATMYMKPTIVGSASWYDDDGELVVWKGNEHCVVLLGHDEEYAYVADPIYGEVKKYDMDVLKKRWIEQDKQAMIIVE